MNNKPDWMISKNTEACGNCRFSEFVGTPMLDCKRHSPIAGNNSVGWYQAVWPSVKPEDHCGDFQPDTPQT